MFSMDLDLVHFEVFPVILEKPKKITLIYTKSNIINHCLCIVMSIRKKIMSDFEVAVSVDKVAGRVDITVHSFLSTVTVVSEVSTFLTDLGLGLF